MSIKYQICSASNQIWLLLMTMAIVTTYSLTIYYIKDQVTVDIEIARAVLSTSSAHCIEIKAKNYMTRADGGQVQGGCSR